jgi:hypothetical protein
MTSKKNINKRAELALSISKKPKNENEKQR